MFAKYALTARIGLIGTAPVGKTMAVMAAQRRQGRITAVWRRTPISGRLEFSWRGALEDREHRNADVVPNLQLDRKAA